MTIHPVRYDSLSDRDRARFLRRIAPSTAPHPRILEIGCASGNFGETLAAREKNPFLAGIDVDITTLATFPGSRILADGAAPPFRSGAFDIVVFSSSLHHVLRIDRTLAEAVRILRPGGRLVLFEPNARHPLRFPEGSVVFRFPTLLRMIQGHLDPAFYPSAIEARLSRLGLRTCVLDELMPDWPKPGWRGRLQSLVFSTAGSVCSRLYPWFLYVGEKR